MQVGSEPEARREISVVEGIAAFDRFRCDGGEYSEDFVKITLFNDEYSFAAYVRILGHLEVQVVLQAKYIKKASLHPANVTQEGWADTESEIPWILHGNLQVNATKGERPFILSPQLGTHIETFDLETEDDIRFIVTIYDAHQDLDHILQPSLAMRTNFSNFHRESDLDVYFQLDEGDELEDPKTW
ncbi:hypothetical protein L0F63_004142 [Massospora cicadina]|nr:hypothetical protein L0F63_004142 [Massospora cicadina]